MGAPSINPDIKINPSSKLRTFISELKADDDDGGDSIEGVPEYSSDDELSLSGVQWIFKNRKLLRERGFGRFHEILRGCDLILPSPIFPPRSPELDARIQKLKIQQENLEYQMMTRDIDGKPTSLMSGRNKDQSFGAQMKEVDRYVMVIFQFVVSVVSAFTFGYLAPYYLYGVVEVGYRLLVGIIIAFVVAIADLYFVIKFLLESEGLITRPLKSKDD